MKKIIYSTIAAACFCMPVAAQDSESDWSLDGVAGFTTDYRDRGLSLSDLDPVVFGSLSLSHESGFYVGSDFALINDQVGGDVRSEFYGGYQFDNGGYMYNLSFELDSIYGDVNEFYPEIKASISRDFGLAFISSGLSFAPEGRWSAPDIDSYYGYLDIEVPVPTLPDITLITHMGYDVLDGRGNLFDWSVGVSAFVKNFEITATFENSSVDDTRGNGRFVFGAKFYF